MAFAIRARIEGLDDLVKTLNELKKSVRNKILRPAMAAAGKVVLKAARAKLKGHGFKSSSLLYKSLGSKVGTNRKGGVYAVVGPRTGYKMVKTTLFGGDGQLGKSARVRQLTSLGQKFAAAGVNPVRYAHLVEKGRRAVLPKKAKALLMKDAAGNTFFGKGAKAVPAKPFLRPALDSTKNQVRDLLAAEIAKGLAKLGR